GPSLADLDKAWEPVLKRLAVCAGTNEPGAMVTFTRLNGETHTVEFHKIVHHVVNHGTYHRGQVAAMLRQSGHAPPSTDLLFYELFGK
ncbi:MAG: DinB family protein, partial [Bryobacteraceae bacterium]